MISLTSTVLLTLASSLLTFVHPDTGTRADTVHFRQVFTDTAQGMFVTSDLAVDHRIRISLHGGPLDTAIVTAWLQADTVNRWLSMMDHASSIHEFALTGEPGGCEANDGGSPPADLVLGHSVVLASAIAITPLNVRGASVYKLDVMEADQNRTATFGVTERERTHLARVLRLALEAAHLLSDAELRRDGPLAIHHPERIPSSPIPAYPEELRREGIEGSVDACFVIDTNGRADMGTFRVKRSSDPDFTRAVRLALFRIRFTPASIEGHVYRQVVRQPFWFTLTRGGQRARGIRH